MKEQTLSVSAIQEGTVIDHIQPGRALQIVHLLKLNANHRRVTLGLNLKSQSMGFKDLIKLEGVFLTQAQAGQVAVFSPSATVNVIKNYEIVDKFPVQIPEAIPSLLTCPNPRCICNTEPVETLFTVEVSCHLVILRCHFCEKTFQHKAVQ